MSAHRIVAAILLSALFVITFGAVSHTPDSHADDDACGLLNNPYNRPEGQLIAYPAGTIYLTSGCYRRHITDTIALNSHHFDGSIRLISLQEFNALPASAPLRVREGTILRNSNTGWLYIIDEIGYQTGMYQKRYITSSGWQALFASCGNYPYTDVTSSYLDTYDWGTSITSGSLRPDGQLISVSGTVYMLEGGKKRWIVNPPALQSYNFAQPACYVSSGEAAQYTTGSNMWAREGTLMASGNPVYIIKETGSAYEKRHIPSRDAFDYYGLDWGAIRPWSQTYVNQYATGPLAHPVKSVFSSSWYKSLVTNDLSVDRAYIGAPEGSWDAQINAARNSWNSAPISPDLFDAAPSANNDVHIEVDNHGNTPWAGRVTFQFANGKVSKAILELNSFYFPNTGLVAHEFGHVLLLAHDGLDPGEVRDNSCGIVNVPAGTGVRVPTTIMDYDCYILNPPDLDGPVNWDFCGVNQKHGNGTVGC